MNVTDRPTPRPAGQPPLRRLLHLLLPDPCAACAAPLEAGAPFSLCLPCRGRLRRHVPGCRRCGRPLPGRRRLPGRCDRCRRRAPAYARLLSPWSYEPPLDAAVHAFKFGRRRHLGERLARPLADLLLADPTARLRDGPAAADLVVAVPLHPLRHLRRGYNQAAALARPLARRLGLPYRSALYRRRATPPQSRLPRQRRRQNLRHAFAALPGAARHLNGNRVVLVDDVATTGATLEAAAETLRAAGARSVTAVALACTPAVDKGKPGGPRRRIYD